MPLLQGTLFAAVFLIPGVFSLAFALAPRGRAMRHSSLSTRAFGLILFSVADWALALCLYEMFIRECGPTLATLLLGADPHARDAVFADLITFPSAVWIGGGLMVLAVVITGGSVGLFHSAALTGMAVHDYRLKTNLLPCAHRWWVRLLTRSVMMKDGRLRSVRRARTARRRNHEGHGSFPGGPHRGSHGFFLSTKSGGTILRRNV